MLDRFGDTSNPRLSNNTAWMCALAPDALDDSARSLAVAERIQKTEPKNVIYTHTLAATLYRAGRFEETIQMMNEVLDAYRTPQADRALSSNPPTADRPTGVTRLPPEGEPSAWLFLSMAHHRLGHGDQAREYHQKALQWLQRVMPETRDARALNPAAGKGSTTTSAVPSGGWLQQRELQLQLREVEDLLGGRRTSAPTTR